MKTNNWRVDIELDETLFHKELYDEITSGIIMPLTLLSANELTLNVSCVFNKSIKTKDEILNTVHEITDRHKDKVKSVKVSMIR